ncbi:MAG: alpha/beta fold hydrolase [Clostridia bacterium]|nr:alpha/beta fold hydrolase [Clostridia bacterium]
MKKLISVVLAAIMLLTIMAPAVSAADTYVEERLPIIYIRGNGEKLYDADGNPVAAEINDISLGGDDSGIDKDVIVETVVNILKPFVLEGMLFDKWDNYGKAIYDEISPLFETAFLDENGNSKNGVTVSQQLLAESEYNAKHASIYGEYDFIYDWRLSPYDNVDRLDDFIDDIIASSGARKVNIFARCMGGSLLMAYLEEHGSKKKVKNVMFCDTLSNGKTLASKALSGKINFSATEIERYIGQLKHLNEIGKGGIEITDVVYEIVYKTMEFFNQVYITDIALDSVERLYNRLYKALMPSLLHASGIASQVNYWSMVYEEDFDEALNLIYGQEGSELRTKYKGLIDKIEYYRDHVTKNLDKLYIKYTTEYGIHVGFQAKYGYMDLPLTEYANKTGDTSVALEDAAYKTTAARVGKTLSEEYIAERVALGKGKYISVDKVVDASTCIFPDTTWIIKNSHHGFFRPGDEIARWFLNGTNVTIDTAPDKYPQFMRYYENKDQSGALEPLTKDNCEDYEWLSDPTEEPTFITRITAIFRFFTIFFDILKALIQGKF